MKSLMLSLLLVPALALAADEQVKPKKPGKGEGKKKANPERAFTKMDANTDGGVSLDEFKAVRGQKNPDNVQKVYARMDADSDGKLTLEEFKTHAARQGEKAGKPKKEKKKPDAPGSDAPPAETPKSDAPKSDTPKIKSPV